MHQSYGSALAEEGRLLDGHTARLSLAICGQEATLSSAGSCHVLRQPTQKCALSREAERH